MPASPFTLSDFDFALPPELIAQHPAVERSSSRLLDGCGPAPHDRIFRELPMCLRAGDLLVLNDTRVIKARLLGEKPTGGAVEALVERILPGGREVLAHLRASKSPRAGSSMRFADAFDAEVLGRAGPEGALFHLRFPSDALALLQAHGHVPLPPYIHHADDAVDAERYQTVFAARPGAVAASDMRSSSIRLARSTCTSASGIASTIPRSHASVTAIRTRRPGTSPRMRNCFRSSSAACAALDLAPGPRSSLARFPGGCRDFIGPVPQSLLMKVEGK